jgi:hypothetical protein
MQCKVHFVNTQDHDTLSKKKKEKKKKRRFFLVEAFFREKKPRAPLNVVDPSPQTKIRFSKSKRA